MPQLPCKKTMFVIEGVLMYLTEKNVRELLMRLAVQTGPGSQIIFTIMNPLEARRINFEVPSRLVDFLDAAAPRAFYMGNFSRSSR